MNLDLREPTPQEWLWINREARGLRLEDVGRTLGISRTRVSAMENGQRRIHPLAKDLAAPDAPLDRATQVKLARRRARRKSDCVAAEMGMAKSTFGDRERDGSPLVVDFWRRKGFVF